MPRWSKLRGGPPTPYALARLEWLEWLEDLEPSRAACEKAMLFKHDQQTLVFLVFLANFGNLW